jgi:polar amino acid transport system substrate-binding protein
MEGGGVDAVVADNGVVVSSCEQQPHLKFKTIADSTFASEQYGIAWSRRATPNCWKKINKGLAGTAKDGTYAIHPVFSGAAASARTLT